MGRGDFFFAAKFLHKVPFTPTPQEALFVKPECDEEEGDLQIESEQVDNEASGDEEKKSSLLSGVRKGIRKLFGAARDMTASFIKKALSVLSLDIKIFRKYKKRFDKHTNREQIRWWFEVWGDESALKALESKWEEVSAENKWWLETCRPLPQPG